MAGYVETHCKIGIFRESAKKYEMTAYLYEAIAAFLEGSWKVRNIAVEIQKRIANGKES